MLDNYAHNATVLHDMNTLVLQHNDQQKMIDQLKQKMQTQHDEMALLQFHHQEIDALHIKPNEWEDINEKHQKLHHTQSIIEHMTQAQNYLQSSNHSLLEQIQKVQKCLNHAARFDKKIQPLEAIIHEAFINISEAIGQVNHYCHQLETDPQSLERLEAKLSAMHTLARKHRIEPSQLLAFKEGLENKMNQLTHLETDIKELESKQLTLSQAYQSLANELSIRRKKSAQSLEKLLSDDMQMLGMEGGVFGISLEKHDLGVHRFGQEHIVFAVSTNPGQPIKPLQDIVSGGELSRLSLALHRHLAEKNQQPTLIFDEVDAGIGGTTADKVGALLKDLSKRYQILCITHLPQIASLADQHCVAQKQSTKDDTQTMMRLLNHQERIEELSRMLGGAHVTQSIKDHAKHLLGQ
jgi:DNA repair protein RecN (Recombination protein N)